VDANARVEITELTDTLRDNLDKVVQHGKRADAIVKNMLLHSREGSGEHRSVDANALVEESLNLAYHLPSASIGRPDELTFPWRSRPYRPGFERYMPCEAGRGLADATQNVTRRLVTMRPSSMAT
jgi:hypothetical protein